MNKVFVIHGWTYDLDKWLAITVQLRARGIDPQLLKVPGLTTPSGKVWDIDGYVSWLDGQLKDAKQPIVVGHSNGGRIALHYAQRHPGRLKQLILIDSAGLAHNQVVPRFKLKLLRLIARIGKVFERIPGLKKLFYKLIGARDYYDAPDNMKVTMRNMLAADNQINYAVVRLPTMLIWGRDDKITPLRDGKKLKKLLPNARLEIINNARHAPFSSHPEEVANIIRTVIEA